MKAERRHELRENDLLHALEATRDYLNENGPRIAVGVIAILAVVVVVSFGFRSRAAAYEDIWRRKNQLQFNDVTSARKSLQDLEALTHETGDDAFILSSLIEQGRQALRYAQQVPFPPDKELNDHARRAFTELKRRYPNNPMAAGLADLGLATVEENEYAMDRNSAHREKAEQLLNSVVQNPRLTGMPFPAMALDRLKSLDAVFTEVVYVPPSEPEETMGPPVDAAPADAADLVDQAEPPVDTP